MNKELTDVNFEETKKEFESLLIKEAQFQENHREEIKAIKDIASRNFEMESQIIDFNNLRPKANQIELIDQALLEVYSLLHNDSELISLRDHVDFVFQKMKYFQENEITIGRNCQNLYTDISISISKTKNSWQLIEENSQKFEMLQAEVKSHFQNNDSLAARETDTREKEADLKEKIGQMDENYQTEIEAVQKEVQKVLEEQRMAKNELLVITGNYVSRSEKLNEEISDLETQIRTEERKIEEVKSQTETLRQDLEDKEYEISMIEATLKSKEELIEGYKEAISNEEMMESVIIEKIEKGKQSVIQFETMTKNAQNAREKLKDEQEKQLQELFIVEKELKNVSMLKSNFESQIIGLQSEVCEAEGKLSFAVDLLQKELKNKKMLSKQLGNLNSEQSSLDEQREYLAILKDKLQIEVENLDSEIKAEIEHNDEKLAQKDRQDKQIRGQREVIHQVSDLIYSLKRDVKTLENKVSGSKNIVKRLNEQAEALKSQQDRYTQESVNAHAKFYEAIEDIKVKNYIISELQEKNKAMSKKLKQQKSLYEAVRNDRNVYLKSLLDMKDNMVAVDKEYQALKHIFKQIKDDTNFKAKCIDQVARNQKLVRNENVKSDKLKKEAEKKILIIEKNIEFFQQELIKLKGCILQANLEKKKKLNINDTIRAERELLSSQFFKRQSELQKLIEKIKSLETNYKIDERFLTKTDGELSEHYKKMRELAKENEDLKSQIKIGDPLKHELINLKKKLVFTKAKNASFREKLDKAINVHRWKKIETTEPEKFEKIMRVNYLQKLLIEKGDELMKLEKEAAQRESELFEVESMIVRADSRDFDAQILSLKEKIKEKSFAMKHMLGELKDAREKMKTLQLEIETIQSKIDNHEKNYFDSKLKEELMKEKS